MTSGTTVLTKTMKNFGALVRLDIHKSKIGFHSRFCDSQMCTFEFCKRCGANRLDTYLNGPSLGRSVLNKCYTPEKFERLAESQGTAGRAPGNTPWPFELHSITLLPDPWNLVQNGKFVAQLKICPRPRSVGRPAIGRNCLENFGRLAIGRSCPESFGRPKLYPGW